MARPEGQKGDSQSTNVGGSPSNPYKAHDIKPSWKDGTGHVVESRLNDFAEKRVGKKGK